MSETTTESEIQTPWPVTAVVSVLFVWALVHSVRTRTVEDYVRYSLYIAVPIAVALLASAFFEWRKSKFRKLTADEVLTIIFTPMSLLVFGAAFYSIAAAIKDLYFWLQSPTLSTNEAVLAAIVGTLAFGSALFYFRLRWRSLYGLTEAVAGLAVAAQRVSSEAEAATNDPAFYLALLTAGVYLFVRGLDNIHQGVTKEPFDPVATRIRDRIRTLSADEKEVPQHQRPANLDYS